MKIKVFNNSHHPLPQYATPQSAGLDLRANIDNDIELKPGCRALVPTGLHIQLPVGYEAQIRPRSGLALKNGITCLNTPGTIDSDYLGDIGVILINHGQETMIIKDGDRIAQMVIAKHETAEWVSVEHKDELGTSERGEGGFGHTGKH